MMTVKELDTKVRNGELKYHHTAKALGYVSRRTPREEYKIESYIGRFVKGYKVHKPSFDSTRYHDIIYCVEQ